MFWRCPICQEPLELEGGTYTCSNHHCFDRSRSGYVNLLPVNRRRSKDPGDNREMVQARQKFLEQGYYAPLVQALCEVLSRWADGTSAPHLILLDAGCGEGYYTAHMAAALEQCGRNVDFGGGYLQGGGGAGGQTEDTLLPLCGGQCLCPAGGRWLLPGDGQSVCPLSGP